MRWPTGSEVGVYATSDTFGGWRVVVGDLHIDVAALRGGPPGGPPDPATRALRLEADLRARDVTVDALARPLDGDDHRRPAQRPRRPRRRPAAPVLAGVARRRPAARAPAGPAGARVRPAARCGGHGGGHPRVVRPLARERRARPRRVVLAPRHARRAGRAPRPRGVGRPRGHPPRGRPPPRRRAESLPPPRCLRAHPRGAHLHRRRRRPARRPPLPDLAGRGGHARRRTTRPGLVGRAAARHRQAGGAGRRRSGPRHLLAPRRDRPSDVRRHRPALQLQQPLRRVRRAPSCASTCGSGS